MRSYQHDDEIWKEACNNSVFPTSYVLRSYCQKHRKLQLHFDDDCNSRRVRHQSYYEFSEDESLVNSLESSASGGVSSVRRQQQKLDSPTSSCLKSANSSKVKGSKKRVNFAVKEEEKKQAYTYTSSSNATAIARRRHYAPEEPRVDSEIIMQSSTSALEELSLTSSKDNNQPPRIVKPRDVLRRPAVRKMMIYPPEGQRGEALTLNKKWSKIQCRVNGDEDTGFRYKVYYLQTFESDKWFPNNTTNSPFYRHDEPDNSTDYAN